MKKLLLLTLIVTFGVVHAALPIQSWTLPNGARVLLVENHALPIVDIGVSVDAGVRRDPPGKSGMAYMARGMLMRGINAVQDEPALNEAQISDAQADLAVRMGGSVSLDRSYMRLRTVSDASVRDPAIVLFARVLAQPAFSQDVLTRETVRVGAAIREADTKPAPMADRVFASALYGSHPYGIRQTVATIEAITRDDLRAFHRTHYVAERTVIALVGDMTRQQADAIARQLTRRLSRATAVLPPLPELPLLPAKTQRIAHPASQAHILMGMPALKRGDPDNFALVVGNYILGGGGFVSRLMNEVREKRGLTYGVSSYFEPLKQPGAFRVSLQTKKAQSAEALDVVRVTLVSFLKDGPTPAEMKAAKDNLIGGFALNIDTNSKMLDYVSVIGYYGLPLDYLDTWQQKVKNVNATDVRAAFGRKLAIDKMSIVIVGAPQ